MDRELEQKFKGLKLNSRKPNTEDPMDSIIKQMSDLETFDRAENFAILNEILHDSKLMILENISDMEQVEFFIEVANEFFKRMKTYMLSAPSLDGFDKVIVNLISEYFSERNFYKKIRLAFDISSSVLENV